MSDLASAGTIDAPPQPYFGVFDLFKIGIGPSSSHAVGPMRAAGAFVGELDRGGLLGSVQRVRVELYGWLALTGIGHGTDMAIIMGLIGEKPDQIDPDSIASKLLTIRNSGEIALAGWKRIPFREDSDLIFNRSTTLDAHPNGIRFHAFAEGHSAEPFLDRTYFSIGGGFVVCEGQQVDDGGPEKRAVPPFSSAQELLARVETHGWSISRLALENEKALRSEHEIHQGLQRIWSAMQECVARGCRTEGVLPGGLNIRRRAPGLFRALTARTEPIPPDPLSSLDWVNLYALAVNEENAAGGRVVTAPTNGAAGIIPAVLHYFARFCPEASRGPDRLSLLTAAVIGSLYKRNASISGARRSAGKWASRARWPPGR